MGDPFSGINIAQRFSNHHLDYEIPQRQDDFAHDHCDQSPDPESLPRDPGKRAEKNGIEEISGRVKLEFWRGPRKSSRQARAPLVVIEGIKGSDDPLYKPETVVSSI